MKDRLRVGWQLLGRIDRVLLTVLISSTLVRLLLVVLFPGFHTGDDVELVQAGFRTAFGLDYQPWNIRNLFVPEIVIAPFLRLGALLGVSDTGWLVVFATLPFVAAATTNIILLWCLARRWFESIWIVRVAVLLYASAWIPLAYGSMAYPRTLAVTCLLGAALLLTGSGRNWQRGLWAGGLVALAFAARYSEVIFLVPLVAGIWLSIPDHRSRIARILGFGIGFAAGIGFTVGLYDAVSWGAPFSSLVAFAKYTLVDKQASTRVISQPWWFYLGRLGFWWTPTLLPALFFSGKGREVKRLWWFVLAPLVVLSCIHHKELRYLQGILPFLMLLAAVGLYALWQRGWKRTTLGLLVFSLVYGVLGLQVVSKKSNAAVSAARAIAADPTAHTVALSQAWAYGDRLYLGNSIAVMDLPVPPTVDDVRTAAAKADRIALYASDLVNNPSLRTTLHSAGLQQEQIYSWGISRSVVVFARLQVTNHSQ